MTFELTKVKVFEVKAAGVLIPLSIKPDTEPIEKLLLSMVNTEKPLIA